MLGGNPTTLTNLFRTWLNGSKQKMFTLKTIMMSPHSELIFCICKNFSCSLYFVLHQQIYAQNHTTLLDLRHTTMSKHINSYTLDHSILAQFCPHEFYVCTRLFPRLCQNHCYSLGVIPAWLVLLKISMIKPAHTDLEL